MLTEEFQQVVILTLGYLRAVTYMIKTILPADMSRFHTLVDLMTGRRLRFGLTAMRQASLVYEVHSLK